MFSILKQLATDKGKTLSSVILLMSLIVLDEPSSVLPSSYNVLVIALWLLIAGLIWSLWKEPKLTLFFWVAATVFAFVTFLQFQYLLPLLVLILWRSWSVVRQSRLNEKQVIVLLLASLAIDNAHATLKLNNVTTCSTVDAITWRLKDNSRNRLIVRDDFTLDQEGDEAEWEMYQVKRESQDFAFVFRRKLAKDGRYLASDRYRYLVAREFSIEEYVDTRDLNRSGKFVKEIFGAKKLKSFLPGQPIMRFKHRNGGMIHYSFSPTGNGVLTFVQGSKAARTIDPVILAGNSCDRPKSLFFPDKKDDKKKTSKKTSKK